MFQHRFSLRAVVPPPPPGNAHLSSLAPVEIASSPPPPQDTAAACHVCSSRDGSFGGEQVVGEPDLLPDAERREGPLNGDLDRPVSEPHLAAGQLTGLAEVTGHRSEVRSRHRSEVIGHRAGQWSEVRAGQGRAGQGSARKGRSGQRSDHVRSGQVRSGQRAGQSRPEVRARQNRAGQGRGQVRGQSATTPHSRVDFGREVTIAVTSDIPIRLRTH